MKGKLVNIAITCIALLIVLICGITAIYIVKYDWPPAKAENEWKNWNAMPPEGMPILDGETVTLGPNGEGHEITGCGDLYEIIEEQQEDIDSLQKAVDEKDDIILEKQMSVYYCFKACDIIIEKCKQELGIE